MASAAVMGVAACGEAAIAEETAVPNEAAYIGYGTGCKGDLTVYVTIADGAITAVTPGTNTESKGPGTNAFEIIEDRVVASQSINVDVVAGATFTSMGVKDALREAVEAAGMLDKFDIPYEAPVPERADGEEYDIVVVGAGGSGLMAAMTAKYPGFDGQASDTTVLVLEKMDFPGGSTMLSSGGFAVGDGLRAHDVAGIHASTADMVELCRGRSEQDVNEPLVSAIFDNAASTMTDIIEFGGPYTSSYTTRTRKFLDISYLQINSTENIYDHDSDGNKFTIVNEGGWATADFLRTKVLQSGTEIRCGAAATALLVEDGAVCGVHVEEAGLEYDVKAKKVVLACGGFSQNAEMCAELNADLPGILPYCCGGCDGDGFAMTKDLGVEVVGTGAISYLGVDSMWGISGELSQAIRKTAAVLVNVEGKRVLCEPGYDENATVYTACGATGHHLVGICDAEHPNAAVVEKYLPTGRGYKADTLEALAEAAGVDAAALAETIEAYNAAYDAGENAEFDTPHDKMTPVKTAPFYAYDVNPISIGTMVGLKVDEHCRLLGQGGDPIPNLYCTGEMCFGGNVLSKTYMGGMSVCTALSTGRIAGDHAVSEL